MCERFGFSPALNGEGFWAKFERGVERDGVNLTAWFLWWEVQPNHDNFLEKGFADSSSFVLKNKDVDGLPKPFLPIPNGRTRQ